MALYEHVFLARQDVSQPQVDELVEQYKGVIEANGGKVGKIEYWGLKSLTFRIKKNRKAHYTLMNIDAPAAALNEMERQMGINEDVLRFLTVRVEKHEEGVSALMQKKERSERRPLGDRDRGPAASATAIATAPRGDRDDRGPRRPREAQEGAAESWSTSHSSRPAARSTAAARPARSPAPTRP